MSVLRFIATVFVFGPMVGLLGTIYGMVHTLDTFQQGGGAREVAYGARIALFTTVFGLLLFPLGVFLHWWIARHTRVYRAWIWWMIFLGSVSTCLSWPVGTMMGVATICLLASLRTFRKMSDVPDPA